MQNKRAFSQAELDEDILDGIVGGSSRAGQAPFKNLIVSGGTAGSGGNGSAANGAGAYPSRPAAGGGAGGLFAALWDCCCCCC